MIHSAEIQIYGMVFVFSSDKTEIAQKYNLHDTEGLDGFSFMCPLTGHVGMCVPRNESGHLNMRVLAHETFHCVVKVMSYIGHEITEHSDEPAAYLMEWFVCQALEMSKNE